MIVVKNLTLLCWKEKKIKRGNCVAIVLSPSVFGVKLLGDVFSYKMLPVYHSQNHLAYDGRRIHRPWMNNSGMSKDLPLLSSLQWNKTCADELWDWENVRISHRISFFMNVLWATNEHCIFRGWTDPPHSNLCLNGMLEFTQQSLHLKWNKQPSTAILWWDRLESTNICLVYVRSQYKLCIQ